MELVKRNYTLDFLKFVFAIIVMLFHSNSLTSDQGQMIFLNGRIGVEFFFLVSGCLMCESAVRQTDRQTDSLDSCPHTVAHLLYSFSRTNPSPIRWDPNGIYLR